MNLTTQQAIDELRKSNRRVVEILMVDEILALVQMVGELDNESFDAMKLVIEKLVIELLFKGEDERRGD